MIKLKDIISEAETFTAINKDTGKVSVFKSKDSRDAAIKGGTHDKKAEKGGDSSAGKKDTPKVNIFDKPKKKDTPKKDEPKKDTPKTLPFDKEIYDEIEQMSSPEDLEYFADSKEGLSDEQRKQLQDLASDWEDEEDAKGPMRMGASIDGEILQNALEIAFGPEDSWEEPKKDDGPVKDSTGGRAGKPEINKAVRGYVKSLGVTPKNLGKEEYQRRMSQAAVKALTDSNFHSEARELISVLEDNPDFAKDPRKDPNMPDIMSPEYDKWRKSSVYGSEYYDSSPGTTEIGEKASEEAGYTGQDAIDAIAFDLKVNGSKELALKIQSIFDNKNESSTSIADMIPESVQINEGTRSQVGVIGRNGKIVSAYVHYDGYPSNMKPGLKHHMKNDKDVLKLIKMGGARGIFNDKDIEYYKSGKPMKGDSKDIESYIKNADRNQRAEYVYLYNMKDKKWYYADTYKDSKLKKLF